VLSDLGEGEISVFDPSSSFIEKPFPSKIVSKKSQTNKRKLKMHPRYKSQS